MNYSSAPDVSIRSGTVTGLVLITPASGFVDQTGAFCMGLIGTPFIYFGLQVSSHSLLGCASSRFSEW